MQRDGRFPAVPPRRLQLRGDRARGPQLPTDLGKRQPGEPLPRVVQADHGLGSIGPVPSSIANASMTAVCTPGAAVPSSTTGSSRMNDPSRDHE